MKKKPDEAIVLYPDHSIQRMALENISLLETAGASYILLPDRDSDGYLLIKPSPILDMEYACVDYIISGEIYDAGTDSYKDLEDLGLTDAHLETTDPVEFYNIIWNVQRIRLAGELLGGDYVDRDSMVGMIIHHLKVHVDIKGESPIDIEAYPKGDISFASETIKIATLVCDTFEIPERDFRHGNKSFRIKKNRWSFVENEEIEPGELIGYVSDMTMQVYFDNGELFLFIRKILNNRIKSLSLSVYGYVIPLIEREIPDIRKRLEANENINNFSLECVFESTTSMTFVETIALYYENDLVAFFINLHYFIRYIEGLVAMITDIPIEDCLGIISISILTPVEKEIYITRYNVVDFVFTLD